MDTFALGQLINAGLQLGPVGLVCVIWYFDRKDQARLIEDHRKETGAILAKYESDAAAAREMYKNNIKLVEGYASIARDLHDIVVLNTRKLTELGDSIRQNEFCPALRVDKKKIEVSK